MAETPPPRRPGGRLTDGLGDRVAASFSELFPSRAAGGLQTARERGFLVPGLIVVAIGVLLFSFARSGAFAYVVWNRCGGPGLSVITYFNLLVGGFFTAGTVYFIYRLCGKPMNWWMAGVAVAGTTLLLQPSLFCALAAPFYALAPDPTPGSPNYVTQAIASAFLATGVLEEAVKAAPILFCWWAGMKLTGPLAEKLKISEPLDGVLCGVFVGATFAMIETEISYVGWSLGKYVPPMVVGLPKELVHGAITTAIDGHSVTETLLFRMVNGIAGHVGYAGIVGYYIGLAAMRPTDRAKTIAIGFAIAVGLHGAWDSLPDLFSGGLGDLVQLGIGGLTYYILITAILKARQISPTRSLNFAATGHSVTIPVSAAPRPTPAYVAPPAPSYVASAPAPAPAPVPAPPVVVAPSGPRGGAPFQLQVGAASLPLSLGTRLMEGDVVGAIAVGEDRVIAIVEARPGQDDVLGIRNRTRDVWRVAYTDGDTREIAPDQVVRILSGMAVDFGLARGTIRVWPA